ncbi:MAG: hypothetical protein Q7S53_03810 [bacterium]|nr:hypothetical protein [bacterium]
MEKETKKKKKKEEEVDGDIFYRAHPIAQPIARVEHRESTLSLTVERVLWWVLGISEVILLFRMVFAAVGANGGNIITSFFYAVSYPLVWFFFYLFNTLGRIQVSSPTFEIETLAAMAFYYIVVYIVVELIKGFRSTD